MNKFISFSLSWKHQPVTCWEQQKPQMAPGTVAEQIKPVGQLV